MATFRGSVRRHIFTPSYADVTFAGRGFPVVGSDITRRLESIPHAVILGFEAGIEARHTEEIEWRLKLVSAELRGFAYEGATMALTVRDSFTRGRRGLARRFLLGAARPHTLLTYIGIGFAMARLPRVLWSTVLPDLTGLPYYPAMSWLAVDGYGFDRAYFDTRRWVQQQYVPRPYPWLDTPDYFLRAVDQGIGRALWFIGGADALAVAAAVGRFGEHRQADLWSGVGLAAAFAGGADPDGLARLSAAAGRFRPELALGAVFAAKARTFAGLVPEHTEAAAARLAGMSSREAAALVDEAVEVRPSLGTGPVYERWRQYVRRQFVPAHPDG